MITTTTALSQAVTLCARASSAGASVTASILLHSDSDTLRLQATDYDLTIDASVPASGGAGGAGSPVDLCIPAKALLAVVGALPSGADVELTQTGDRLTVTCGRSVWHLSGIPSQEWPALDVVDVPADAPLLPDLSPVACAVSSDESRPALNGISIGDGVAVATDGHRLHTAPASHNGEPVTLHRRALAALGALGGTLRYTIDGQHIGVAGSIGTMTVRRVQEVFPDWRRVLPDTPEHTLTIDRAALVQAIRRVSVVGGGKHALLRLSVAGGVVVLEMTHPDMGDARAELDQADTGPDDVAPIGFNPRYLLEALDAVGTSGGDVVELGVSDCFSPVRVRAPGAEVGAGVICICMPMRL
jgi:DNA polymerase-3 subunit beta